MQNKIRPAAKFILPSALHKEELFAKNPIFKAADLIPSFKADFPEAFNLLRLGGVHPEIKDPFFNPYSGQLDQRDFSNVGEHSIAVAFAANRLSKALSLPASQIQLITERALLHDAAKRFEVFRREAKGHLKFTPGEETARELESLGVDRNFTSKVKDFGTETGGETIGEFLEINSGAELVVKPALLSQKIVRLADNMTSTDIPAAGEAARTIFVTLAERAVASEFSSRYKILFTSGLAAKPDLELTWLDDINALPPGAQLLGSLIDLEQLFQSSVSEELCLRSKLLSVRGAEASIKELLNSSL